MGKKNITSWFDPYTYVDLLLFKLFGKPDKLQIKIIYWVFYILFSLLFAYLLYQIIGLALGSSLPLATVVSGSMEPSFYRGDIVLIGSAKNLKAEVIEVNDFISNKDLRQFAKLEFFPNEYGLSEIDTLVIGDQRLVIKDAITNNNSVVVYRSNTTGRDIIHRAVVVINAKDGTFILTKGDNSKTNRIIDQDCKINLNTGVPGNMCLHIYPINVNDLIGKKIGKLPYVGYFKLFLLG